MVSKLEQSSATRARIIRAATEAFASSGLEGATTKEIAQIAGVNEVTLFRHFQSKERLLAAVVEESMAEGEEPVLSRRSLAANAKLRRARNVREILRLHASAQHHLLTQNLPIIRAFIGEIHRHCGEETVTKAVFLRHRQAMEADLKMGQKAGLVRKDVNLNIVANQLMGVIFSDVLKRSSPSAEITYSWEEYLEASIDLFAGRLECARSSARKPKSRAI